MATLWHTVPRQTADPYAPRQRIGRVPQDSVIFSGIALVTPSERMMQAAREAAMQFVTDGYGPV